MYVLVAILGSGRLLQAQTAGSPDSGFSPLARYLPPSADVVVTVAQLDAVDRALDRANAWPLLTLSAGGDGDDRKPFDVRSAVGDFFGVRKASAVRAIMQTELGVAASSSSMLRDAVWVLRLPTAEALKDWFPEDQRVGGAKGRVSSVFRTQGGLYVSSRGEIAAIGRHIGGGTLLREAMGLVLGSKAQRDAPAASAFDPNVRLPAGPLAVAQFKDLGSGSSGSSRSRSWWPAAERLVVGMYAGENQLDFAIRTSLARPMASAPLSRDGIDHFRRLPSTTLFAMATVADLDPRFSPAVKTAPASAKSSSGALQRYLALLAGFRDPAVMGTGSFPRVGPQLIFVWGQDFTERGGTPQIAMLAECDEPQSLQREMDHIVGNLLKVANAISGGDDSAKLTIERRTRLGVRVSSVSMGDFASGGNLAWAHLLSGTELSWAAWGKWFVCALTREHLERILEAYNGLRPTLDELPEVESLQPTASHRSSVAVLRADLAADVMDGWLRAYESDSPSLLDPMWWEQPGRQSISFRRYFGIRMSPSDMEGTVFVSGVERGAAASGLIQKGDRIQGVDGKLLDLDGARADLRRQMSTGDAREVTLRVIRGGRAMSIVLRRAIEETPQAPPLIEPAQALRELAALGRSLELVTFTALVPEGKRYSARLTLRFAPLPEE